MPDDPNGFARDLFDGLPARYDRLAELLSFGQNGQWRAEMVGHIVPADGVILDVASGTAGVALQLATRNAREHGQARVVGADGSMILINNVVSQSVPHLHLHVIPRSKGDGLRFWLGPRHPYDDAHPAEAYAEKIKAALPS